MIKLSMAIVIKKQRVISFINVRLVFMDEITDSLMANEKKDTA
jgi:hypothetical protein